MEHEVESVRAFNRFYTRKIGVLEESLLHSPFSLAEARVIYELAHRDRPAASSLAADLGLDAGYLSRILRGFEKRRLISRKPSPSDARQSLLSLSRDGRRAFAGLDSASRGEITALLRPLADEDRARLVQSMQTIEELLDPPPVPAVPYILRPPRPGDMGWVVARHGALYAQEYRWNEQFEGLVARIVAEYIRDYDPKRESCWIAERSGEPAGSVFLVEHSKSVAKLRLLLVEPKARGLGIGGRLVEECISFARSAGYRKMILWTNNVLHAARHIYEKAGFRLTREEPHHSFGHDLVGETWERKL